MAAHAAPPQPLFAPPRIIAEAADSDGAIVLRSAEPLGEYPVSVVHSVREWARLGSDHPLIAERAGGGWRTVSYGAAVAAADAVGQALLDRGLGPGRPLLMLSGNSVDHLLVTLGAMTAGIPVAPVSVAYSPRWPGTTTRPDPPLASSGCWSWRSRPAWTPGRSPTRATSTSARSWLAGPRWWNCCTPTRPRRA
jgi:hypothetical protein